MENSSLVQKIANSNEIYDNLASPPRAIELINRGDMNTVALIHVKCRCYRLKQQSQLN